MKTLLVFCAIVICLASSERYWRLCVLGKPKYCLSYDGQFHDIWGKGGWKNYWTVDKKKEIDGIKFISLKNQAMVGNGGKVLDVKGDCPGNKIHLWDAHSGYPEYQLFAFLENGTILSACKNSKGQFQVLDTSSDDFVKVEREADLPQYRTLFELIPYDASYKAADI